MPRKGMLWPAGNIRCGPGKSDAGASVDKATAAHVPGGAGVPLWDITDSNVLHERITCNVQSGKFG
jgi:hypothetical protein